MSPFIGNPIGISAETLQLLDDALSVAWRECQAVGDVAAMSQPASSDKIAVSDKGIANECRELKYHSRRI